MGVGVGDGVNVGVSVGVGVAVDVGNGVTVGVAVTVAVGVTVGMMGCWLVQAVTATNNTRLIRNNVRNVMFFAPTIWFNALTGFSRLIRSIR